MPKSEAPSKRGRGKAASKKEGKKDKKKSKLPKRGLSAYMFFANEKRDGVRKEKPGITFGETGKRLGDKWKALEPADKEPYKAQALADKKRYEAEKEAMLAAPEEESEE